MKMKIKSDEKLTVAEIIKGGTNIDNIILKSYNLENSKTYGRYASVRL